MNTTRKSQAARANGAKSCGPKTDAGRAASSQNALKHGLTALKFVLPTEDRDEFFQLRDAYLQRFQPAGQIELRVVETMVLCDYRLRRLITIETNILSNEMIKHGPQPDSRIFEMDDEDRLAWSFNYLANNHHSLALLSRYQGQIDRAYHRAAKQLRELQSSRPTPQPAPASGRGHAADARQPNEPTGQPTLYQQVPPPPPDPAAAPHPPATGVQPHPLTGPPNGSLDTRARLG